MQITWWLVVAVIVDLCVRVAAIIIVPRNRRPTAAMAWLLAIYFIPYVGVLLFLLVIREQVMAGLMLILLGSAH